MLVQDSPLRRVLLHNLNFDETRISQALLDILAAEYAHFKGRAGTTVEDQLLVNFELPVGGSVHQNVLLAELNDPIVAQVREVFDGLRFICKGDRKNEVPTRL
jgi:hypothetical protein